MNIPPNENQCNIDKNGFGYNGMYRYPFYCSFFFKDEKQKSGGKRYLDHSHVNKKEHENLIKSCKIQHKHFQRLL